MRDTVIRWGIRQCECESGWKSPAYCCLLSCLNSAPATTTEEEKSVNRVTTPLRCSHRCSSHYPLSQATGPGLQVSFWRTHEKESETPAHHNKLSKWQLVLVSHNTPPHKKRKKKKAYNPKLLSPFFGERRQGWRSVGIFGSFFSVAWHPLSMPVLWARRHGHLLALWPAALERGRGACRDGRARNMFRRVCLETGGLGQRWSGGGQSQAQLTDTTRPLSHSQSLSHHRLSRSTSAFFFPPMRSLPPCRGLKSHFNCPFFAVWPSPLVFLCPTGVMSSLMAQAECRWIVMVSLSLWFNWQVSVLPYD